MSDKYKELNEEVKDLFEKLKTERDELKVKVHLGKADMSDKWNAVEEKWESFKKQK